ncbi:MAG: sialidase family protein [bacterium]|nr:sialidase family protein [bacterium]
MVQKLIVLSVFLGCTMCLAQNAKLIYREREPTTIMTPVVGIHGESGDIYVAIAVRGLYKLDKTTWQLMKVEEITNNGSFQYNDLYNDRNGDVLLSQHGFFGYRLFAINAQGTITERVVPDINGLQSYGDGLLHSGYSTSIDGGRSWSPDSSLNLKQLNSGFILAQTRAGKYIITTVDLGGKFFPVPIRRPDEIAVFAGDSLVWTEKALDGLLPDTICYGSIHDSTYRRCETQLIIPGAPSAPILSQINLISSTAGGLVLFSPRQGWYARYSSEGWVYMGSLPPLQYTAPWSNLAIGLYSTQLVHPPGPDRVGIISIYLQEPIHTTIDTLPQGIGPSVDPRPLSDSYSLMRTGYSTMSLFHRGLGLVNVGSLMRDLDDIKINPILCGFVTPEHTPIVVPWSDGLTHISAKGYGVTHATSTRGEQYTSHNTVGPYYQSTRGLRTLFVGHDAVLAPGNITRVFSRSGELLDTLDTNASTCVYRLADGTSVVANKYIIRRISPEGARDSVDLRPVLCNAASNDSTGFVIAYVESNSQNHVALVSHQYIVDDDTRLADTNVCGGIVYSSDGGASWETSSLPVGVGRYFLGMTKSPSGALLASVTTLLYDTTRHIQIPPPFNAPSETEAVNHRMEDCHVLRSADHGRTWATVYHASFSRPYRFIGGDGVATNDGRLLLMSPDGVIESTDDGLSWHAHALQFEENTQVISLFRDPDGNDIYYCTDKGLYKSTTTTSVSDSVLPARSHKIRAATWEEHGMRWNRANMTLSRLVNLMGVSCSPDIVMPGMYVVTLSTASTSTYEQVLVLP